MLDISNVLANSYIVDGKLNIYGYATPGNFVNFLDSNGNMLFGIGTNDTGYWSMVSMNIDGWTSFQLQEVAPDQTIITTSEPIYISQFTVKGELDIPTIVNPIQLTYGYLVITGTTYPNRQVNIVAENNIFNFTVMSDVFGNFQISQDISYTDYRNVHYVTVNRMDANNNIVYTSGTISVNNIYNQDPVTTYNIVCSYIELKDGIFTFNGQTSANTQIAIFSNDYSFSIYTTSDANGNISIVRDVSMNNLSFVQSVTANILNEYGGIVYTGESVYVTNVVTTPPPSTGDDSGSTGGDTGGGTTPTPTPTNIYEQVIKDIQLITEEENVDLITLYIRKARKFIHEYVDHEFQDSELNDISDFITDLVVWKFKDNVTSETLGDFSVHYDIENIERNILTRLRKLKIKKGRLVQVW